MLKFAKSARVLTLVGILLLCATFTVAQSTTFGAIAGTVTDQTKALVPKAKVTITSTATNEQKTAESDSFGKFRVTNLVPGAYTVNVDAGSFAKYKASQVIVMVGRITELDIALAAAGAAETVNVTGEAPSVNTIQQDFSQVIDNTAINNLPSNGRRWSTYALLTPGTVPDGTFGLISFRGISGLLNNNTVDGGDNNQAFFSEERGRTRISYTVSQSSVQEFQVNTSNYSSEYGRAAGGVVNSVTKAGGNAMHGEGFWYIRDNALGAVNPFTTRTIKNSDGTYSTPNFKPEDRRQQFGGSLGGPIIKDKLFYFFTYDAQRRNFPGVAQASNPSAFFAPITVLNPALRSVGGKALTCASSGITEGEYLFCKGFSQAQANQGLDFFAAETGTVPRTGDQGIIFPKLDWKINNSNTVTVSYNRMRWDSPAGIQTQPTVAYAVDSFGNDYAKTDMLNVRLTSTLNPNMTNEFRYSWGRDYEYETSQEASPVEQQYKLVTSYGNRPPTISVTNGVQMGRYPALERYAYPDERRHQFADSMSIAKGHHFFKFGVDFNRSFDLMNSLYNGGGNFSYSGTYARPNFIMDLLNNAAGTPTANYGSYAQAFGPFTISMHTWDQAFFFQDDWKVLPRLTLNLGIRYEYEKLPDMIQGYVNPLVPQTGSLPSDKNNFGPRVGFALDVFGDGKTAVRGGYGLYYGRINNGAITGALFNNGSPSAQVSFSGLSATCGPTFPNVWDVASSVAAIKAKLPASCLSTSSPNGFYFDPKLQNPQIHQADLIIERQVSDKLTVSLNYLLSAGHELPNFVDMNVAPSTKNVVYQFATGPYAGRNMTVPFYDTRINPAIGNLIDLKSNINSNYNALVISLSRRMSHGLQFNTNYTWSHALDWNQNSTTQTASYANVYDPYNAKAEYGTSSFDRRHRFVTSAVYQPVLFGKDQHVLHAIFDGWGIAPIFTWTAPQPFTESVSGNAFSYVPAAGAKAASIGSMYGLGGGINGSGGVFRLAPMTGRNSWQYPMFINTDLRLSRKFSFREHHSVEFVSEAFNLFNHRIPTGITTLMYTTASPANVAADAGTATNPVLLKYNPSFGLVNQAGTNLYRERQIQFAVRYAF